MSDDAPRVRIEAESRRRGLPAFVAGCVALLEGDDVDDELVQALGGRGARVFLDDRERDDFYWLRVWAARGLLWQADRSAQGAVSAALADEHWRVREMALRVIARHHWGELLDSVSPLERDPVPRVRAAAGRALRTLTAARD